MSYNYTFNRPPIPDAEEQYTKSRFRGILGVIDQTLYRIQATLREKLTEHFGAFTANHEYENTGIKVDIDDPAFPWHDLLGDIQARGTGPTDPNWATYRGNIKQYQFTVGDEVWNIYHIPHDYVPNSALYLHVHWSHIATTVTGGSVTWGWDVTYAKGHNQAAFPATVNPTLVCDASTTQYQHIISEFQLSDVSPSGTQIDSTQIEPDGVILLRTYLSANDITVSGGGTPEPFLHYVDLHFQSTGIGTKQKDPNFWRRDYRLTPGVGSLVNTGLAPTVQE